jgi:hypothetical protein
MKNANITSLERVLTWSEAEVDKMIKTYRMGGVEVLPDVEKNLQLMVGEAQIRHQTHRLLTNMHSATIDDFEQWLYPEECKEGVQGPALYKHARCTYPFQELGKGI